MKSSHASRTASSRIRASAPFLVRGRREGENPRAACRERFGETLAQRSEIVVRDAAPRVREERGRDERFRA